MNKIKNWFDDILWIIEDVISIILFIIWFTIFICIPLMILEVLCKLKLLSESKYISAARKLLKWWKKLIISPEDEAMLKEDYDLAKRLEKNN